ncbi:flagellar biosynthesis protein [Wigglesworthia glossinidia endosymbiont of Glossina morsitans morsitans (Yale colony)]|uniref:Flagellar protein FliL n=2 Tax=Wigglesworthia glossinidia TaxID=51229 RepID=H6Q5L5_WIGGL|nr:flagellar biosynthesis protein [Wigglesworthia glossinidia endosymbiont of Glossina morsitans morsitans (Yale colony)]
MAIMKFNFFKRPIVIAMLIGAIISIILGVIYFQPWIKNKNDIPLLSQAAENVPVESSSAQIYFPLDAFTVSLQPEDGEYGSMLYIGLTLKLKNESVKELLESKLPELRNQLILLLSQQTPSSLSSSDGKNNLLKEIKKELNKQSSDNQIPIVNDVFFNSFIIR